MKFLQFEGEMCALPGEGGALMRGDQSPGSQGTCGYKLHYPCIPWCCPWASVLSLTKPEAHCPSEQPLTTFHHARASGPLLRELTQETLSALAPQGQAQRAHVRMATVLRRAAW